MIGCRVLSPQRREKKGTEMLREIRVPNVPLVLGAVLAPASLLAQIAASPSVIDFGERGHNERPRATLTIENRGREPVQVRGIQASCGCIEVSPAAIPRPIPPGGSERIEISMGSGRAMGTLEKHVTILTNDLALPSTVVPVRMRVFPGFEMEPRDLRFDGVVGGKPIAKTLDVVYKGPGGSAKRFELSVDAVKSAGASPIESPHFRAKVSEFPGGKRIELTLLPTHPEGRIWANLEARLDGKPLVVPVAGEMFRGILVVPTYFNFSRVSVEEPDSFVEEVSLSSTDDRKFKILSMTPTFRAASPKDTRLELELRDGKVGVEAQRHVIRARIAPPAGWAPTASQGSFSGQVSVKTDHPEKPEVTLSFFGFFDSKRK
jgi:hypothetical protein